jgi:hypothetical protein
MTPQARWQRAMIGGPGLDSLFSSVQLGFPSLNIRADIKPTRAEIDNAVASIRAWRVYLPPACVAAMIKDGWQWST